MRCKLEGCTTEFTPKVHWQLYCSDKHKDCAIHRRLHQRRKRDRREKSGG